MNPLANSLHIPLGSETIFVHTPAAYKEDDYLRWNTSRHCNADYELHIVLDGECLLEVADQSHTLHANTGVIIPPNVFHHPNVKKTPFRRFSLSFAISGNLLLNAVAKRDAQCLVFPITPAIAVLCNSIRIEYASDHIYKVTMIQSYLSELIISILRCLNLDATEKHNLSPTEESARVITIDGFFDNLSGSCTEDSLAQMLHLSKRQLSRTLHRHYGVGFRQKLLDARMDRASWLLRTTSKPIGEIAELVGYASESAFFQAFKAYFGITPLRYRKQHL